MKKEYLELRRLKTREIFEYGVYLIVFIQVALLISLTFANSYQIRQTEDLIEIASGRGEDFSDKVIEGVLKLLEIKGFGTVSAQLPFYNRTKGSSFQSSDNFDGTTFSWNCCIETVKGAKCQDIAPGVKGICEGDALPTPCSEVSQCQIGTCLDAEEGLCTTKAPQGICLDDGGEWFDDPNANVPQCERGCCVMGSDIEYVTEQRCNYLSFLGGYSKDFRDYQTELDCIALKETQDYGACVLNTGGCSFGTELECLEIGGIFKEDMLCSNPSLNTGCEAQASIGCAEGFDEIYWYDSCGNRENIYSSDKDSSWNNGNVLDKSESCNPTSGNVNSESCGNCNNMLSSICSSSSDASGKKVKDGNFVCRDLRCIDEDGEYRENGESWCVYDSYIGDGKDTVGSRHWKRYCEDGVVKSEGCADYRGQVCVESEIGIDENEKFTNAACVTNEAYECLDYNSEEDEEEMISSCNEHSQCQLTTVDVSDTFKFNVCTAKYPRGFDLTGNDEDTAEELCAIANQECTVMYEKKVSGWECIMNCECEEEKFAEQMNNLCIALGDCGAYVNYEGYGTDNFVAENTKLHNDFWKDYGKYAIPVKGQKAEPADLEDVLIKLGVSAGKLETEEDKISQAITQTAMVMGGIGIAAKVGAGVAYASTNVFGFGLGESIVHSFAGGISGGTGSFSAVLTSVATFATVFGIAMLASTIFTYAFGLQGDAATIMAISGVTVGIAFGLAAVLSDSQFFAGCALAGPLWWACLLVVAAIMLLIATALKFLEIGETKEVKVKFECLPWEAPVGNQNCEACNEDPLKPCSEYRCSALGQNCQILNSETTNPLCVQKETNDGKPPVITTGNVLVPKGYELKQESRNRASLSKTKGDCIQEFTSVFFVLKTDDYSQCKYDFFSKENFEGMRGSFLEANSFTQNHTMSFVMPSISSVEVYNVSGNMKEKFANVNMHVRCQDIHGNYNEDEFVINTCVNSGPDLTPPEVVATDPVDKAYLKYNLTEIPLTIFLSEPSQCKYSFLDEQYEKMPYNMSCKTGLTEFSSKGWGCSTQLSGLIKDENKIYYNCLDQPWKPLNETGKRNKWTENKAYTLLKTKELLKIKNIKPQGGFELGIAPVSVDLEVETAGGIDSGISTCSYKFEDNPHWVRFKDSYSSKHKQHFTSLFEGDYNISIKCEDDAGNADVGSSEFSLNLDYQPPIVTRVYSEGGSIKMLTDEEAICYYDFNRCNFDIENASSASTNFNTEHSIYYQEGKEYHIKCEDSWGNTNPECAIIIKQIK